MVRPRGASIFIKTQMTRPTTTTFATARKDDKGAMDNEDEEEEEEDQAASAATTVVNGANNADMDDVMKVLTSLGDDFAMSTSSAASSNNAATAETNASSSSTVDNLTSVEDVSHVVDKASLADEKFLELSAHQIALEKRFEELRRRADFLRLRHLGSHVGEQIRGVVDLCGKVAPQPKPQIPKINPLNLIGPPPSVPEGIVLPSVPIKEEPMTTSSTAEETAMLTQSVEPPSLQDRQKAEEVLGQLQSNLHQVLQSYDSEATESSSGGESADELDSFSAENTRYVSVRKRAKYGWLSNRAAIASKWTWLTAQISDLEYRIRQQTEFYRQIRAAKGAVTLGEAVVSWPPHAKKPVQSIARPDQDVPLSCKPVTRDYSRVDAYGRKIIIKEPMTTKTPTPTSSESDNCPGASRTRPVKVVRRRRILQTRDLHLQSGRAAKESSVRCDCIQPLFWCAICFGASNHSQAADPVTQDRSQCLALLDHSYHQVLSGRQDVSLGLLLSQKIKSRGWLTSDSGGRNVRTVRDASATGDDKKKWKRLRKDGTPMDEEERRKRKAYLNKLKREKLKRLKGVDGKRRKSLSVQHHGDVASMYDLSSDGDGGMSGVDGSPVASPAVPSSNQAWADHIRRKRETAYDINNIVIPYSMAASTRVEKIKYKEILTPTWREIDYASNDAQPTQAEEDVSVALYETRHAKAELEEQRRWQLPLWKSSGGQRSRARRQDSCRTEASSGCNTPDPLSPAMVDTLEVQTRPSTPDGSEQQQQPSPLGTPSSSTPMPLPITPAGSIKNRRRTSSATKSRDRNPSEDQQPSSRCTTPTPEFVDAILPYEPRTFPIDDDVYEQMQSEMPPPLPARSASSSAPPNPSASSSTAKAATSNNHNAESTTLQMSIGSSADEEDEEDTGEDPDWNGEMEDPDDPEWQESHGESTAAGASASNATANNPNKKGHGLSLKMPKTNT